MKKFKNYYDKYSMDYLNYDSSNMEIKSDFNLIVILFIHLFSYLLFLIPNLFLGIIFILFNYKKSRIYFRRVFIWPFEILGKISHWFFTAKYTANLIIFLFIVYILEIVFHTLYGSFPDFLAYSFFNFFEWNWWSIFTSIFLHNGILHLVGNCLALIVFGRVVEKHFGGFSLLIFYVGGIIADLISGFIFYLQSDITTSVGASAGITALIIVAIFLEPFTFSTFPFLIPIPIFVLGWISIFTNLMGVFRPSSDNIDYLAHLGGYLALVFFFFFFGIRNRNKIIKGLILNLGMFVLFYVFLRIIGINLFI